MLRYSHCTCLGDRSRVGLVLFPVGDVGQEGVLLECHSALNAGFVDAELIVFTLLELMWHVPVGYVEIELLDLAFEGFLLNALLLGIYGLLLQHLLMFNGCAMELGGGTV